MRCPLRRLPHPKGLTSLSFRPVQRSVVPGRIKPEIAFSDASGRLPMPAQGRQVLGFSEKTQFGGQSKGIVLETRQGAQVTSPCDGWIVYAGEFRSYGQLLIINAGGGYHVLLAGLSQIDVQPGQFVLAAEPVGTMSGWAQQAQPAATEQCARPLCRISQGWEAYRSRPMVGGGSSKGARIMRKTEFAFWTFLLMTGLAGATTLLNVTRTYSATSAEFRAL